MFDKIKKYSNENNYDKILNWHKIHGNTLIIDIKGCLYKSVYNKEMSIVDDIIFLYPSMHNTIGLPTVLSKKDDILKNEIKLVTLENAYDLNLLNNYDIDISKLDTSSLLYALLKDEKPLDVLTNYTLLIDGFYYMLNTDFNISIFDFDKNLICVKSLDKDIFDCINILNKIDKGLYSHATEEEIVELSNSILTSYADNYKIQFKKVCKSISNLNDKRVNVFVLYNVRLEQFKSKQDLLDFCVLMEKYFNFPCKEDKVIIENETDYLINMALKGFENCK